MRRAGDRGQAAGLPALLQLGRSRRSVVVVDAGEPRNLPVGPQPRMRPRTAPARSASAAPLAMTKPSAPMGDPAFVVGDEHATRLDAFGGLPVARETCNNSSRTSKSCYIDATGYEWSQEDATSAMVLTVDFTLTASGSRGINGGRQYQSGPTDFLTSRWNR